MKMGVHGTKHNREFQSMYKQKYVFKHIRMVPMEKKGEGRIKGNRTYERGLVLDPQ